MLFVRFSGLLKPTALLTLFTQNYCRAPLCPHVDQGEKHQYAKPDCSKAVIVGGTGTVGLAIANQLLCNKAGKVALIDTDICKGKDAIASLNCSFGKEKAMFIKADVTNKMEIQDSLKKARGDLKQVDMIVNAFGVWNESNWESQIAVNLMGILNVNDIAKEIVLRPGGFVLNITGVPGVEIFPPCPVLAASYLGVVGYSQAKGHERAASVTGVRTVALCCGITHSPMVRDVDKKTCCAQMGNDLKKYLNDTCWQKADVVGKAVVEVLKYAPTGTVWVVEGSRLFVLKMPEMNTFRSLENQFI